MSQIVPGLRLLRFALRLVLDTVDDGREETIQPSLDVAYLDLFEGLPDRLLALLATEPPLRASRELNIVLDRKRYHRLPEFAVVAAEKLEVNHVAAAIASITPVAALRIEVERGGAILMVRQRTATGEPGCASKRLEVCVAASDLVDRDRPSNGFAASSESI